MPLATFITERIETTSECEVVLLTEIESPSSLDKNVVLWVDDIPQGNLTLAKTIETRNDCL